MRHRLVTVLLVVLTAATAACSSEDDRTRAAPRAPTVTTRTLVADPASTAPSTSTSVQPAVVPIPYRIERRTHDDATSDFEAVVTTTLADPRGWTRARFAFDRTEDGPYLIVLAEGADVDALCRPYDTGGKYSCQNGPVVALNADRWRTATPKWTGDLDTYRRMLVNHEVGHLLGMKHPRPQCPAPGRPAPIMNQQSTELDGCLPNPWPLDDEIENASRHDRPLAPGPGE
ncbi:MAG TPA: DUF3152 domain-containing protein [Acidimicrobiales bacterium]|nr:DUF3152 domain-containing protein [Acidimicrobiales bacterium]